MTLIPSQNLRSKIIKPKALKWISVTSTVDFGHTEPMITLPIGIRCRIDTNGSAGPVIQFLESAVS
jgi:muramoyltetrapeptide carboxypeptidase LdcA involved in peptidoglycan recycling